MQLIHKNQKTLIFASPFLIHNSLRKWKWTGLNRFFPHKYLLFWLLLHQMHIGVFPPAGHGEAAQEEWVPPSLSPSPSFLSWRQCWAWLHDFRALPLSGGCHFYSYFTDVLSGSFCPWPTLCSSLSFWALPTESTGSKHQGREALACK